MPPSIKFGVAKRVRCAIWRNWSREQFILAVVWLTRPLIIEGGLKIHLPPLEFQRKGKRRSNYYFWRRLFINQIEKHLLWTTNSLSQWGADTKNKNVDKKFFLKSIKRDSPGRDHGNCAHILFTGWGDFILQRIIFFKWQNRPNPRRNFKPRGFHLIPLYSPEKNIV
jgi:hypothetical protein